MGAQQLSSSIPPLETIIQVNHDSTTLEKMEKKLPVLKKSKHPSHNQLIEHVNKYGKSPSCPSILFFNRYNGNNNDNNSSISNTKASSSSPLLWSTRDASQLERISNPFQKKTLKLSSRQRRDKKSAAKHKIKQRRQR